MGKISKPELITHEHITNEFDCGIDSLNEWLQKRALKNQNNYSKTRVACFYNKVIAYYTLAFGSVNREEMKRKIQQNAPDRIPVMVLGRLAVDKDWQRQGIAKHLLMEAMLKTLEASLIAGMRGILVNAIDTKAESFYLQYGFIKSKVELTLFLPIEDIKAQIDLDFKSTKTPETLAPV